VVSVASSIPATLNQVSLQLIRIGPVCNNLAKSGWANTAKAAGEKNIVLTLFYNWVFNSVFKLFLSYSVLFMDRN
jgi:hypothetical protein